MKVKTKREDEFKDVETVTLQFDTLITGNKTYLRIKHLYNGNLEITKSNDMGSSSITIMPVTSNQIQIRTD